MDKKLYEFMKVKQGTFINWRTRNKIPYEEISTICIDNSFDLNYILIGDENSNSKTDFRKEVNN